MSLTELERLHSPLVRIAALSSKELHPWFSACSRTKQTPNLERLRTLRSTRVTRGHGCQPTAALSRSRGPCTDCFHPPAMHAGGRPTFSRARKQSRRCRRTLSRLPKAPPRERDSDSVHVPGGELVDP